MATGYTARASLLLHVHTQAGITDITLHSLINIRRKQKKNITTYYFSTHVLSVPRSRISFLLLKYVQFSKKGKFIFSFPHAINYPLDGAPLRNKWIQFSGKIYGEENSLYIGLHRDRWLVMTYSSIL